MGLWETVASTMAGSNGLFPFSSCRGRSLAQASWPRKPEDGPSDDEDWQPGAVVLCPQGDRERGVAGLFRQRGILDLVSVVS